MSEYQPFGGREIVRGQLALEIGQRFSMPFNPTLVFIDGEWHYPITKDETYCELAIPDPVTAVKHSDFAGPSTKACAECSPPVGGMTKRALRRHIVKYLDNGGVNSAGFDKAALQEIFKELELKEKERREVDE